MNFYKNLSVIINDRNIYSMDRDRTSIAETNRFTSIFKLLDIEQFDILFKKALEIYWGEDYSKMNQQDEVVFLAILKKEYENVNIKFQIKDAEELDFEFHSGELVETKTTRYKVLTENLLNALEMDGSGCSDYVYKLLRSIRKRILNEQSEKAS